MRKIVQIGAKILNNINFARSMMNTQSIESSYSWRTVIDNLMFWKAGSWLKYYSKCNNNLELRVHYDQLMLIDENKILETINMNSKLKGIFRGEVLILIISTGQEVRKLKFHIRDNSFHFFKLLGEHFPVTSHKGSSPNNITYRNMEDIIRKAMNDKAVSGSKIRTPSNYEDFVKLCLLDPIFPNIVHETQKVIQSILNPNSNKTCYKH